MEKITTKAELIERIKDQKAVEIEARDSYEDDIAMLKNKKLISTIKSIKIDEEKHIALLDDILKGLKD